MGILPKDGREVEMRVMAPGEREPPGGADGSLRIEVRTFGAFSVTVAGRPLVFSRKAPRKPLNLLKAIVAMGHPGVCEYRLTDALWPDSDADAAHQAFNMALHRLRKLLGSPLAVVLQDGRVHLPPQRCRVDRWELEALVDSGGSEDPGQILRQTLDCYRGPFLPDDDASWTIGSRERLREHFVRLVTHQARRLEGAGRWSDALGIYRQALDVCDGAEILYQGAMRAALQLNQRADGVSVFHRLQRVLPALYGVAPSTDTEALFAQLLG